mmetsp:Transcript_3034/g.5366  ORF Transcript_3034/g.5366 Transcript_3034/m.5366 type:complete len:911 (-) Transcript_3034:1001-3733(-)|eukprot:CAMPEP_0182445932 /NCGR_PEP_ID=MMETSP1172-20130603/3876_1 /TAXON_ID=708627 /ORGANISM="Timspurckia oligopyrenoides, Strain CCMP3278" /LENGTH=910 /DNA_ID=CAMNT_0024641771 /DNA_START=272 /DNA_END=3004 /DNA_ORIENTATION=+
MSTFGRKKTQAAQPTVLYAADEIPGGAPKESGRFLTKMSSFQHLNSEALSPRENQNAVNQSSRNLSPGDPNESEMQKKLREQIGTIKLSETPEAALAKQGIKVNAPGRKPSGSVKKQPSIRPSDDPQALSPRVTSPGSPTSPSSRIGSVRQDQPISPSRVASIRQKELEKPWEEMTEEERVRKKMLDDIGGMKSMSSMPEFTMLAEMGVKVNKPGSSRARSPTSPSSPRAVPVQSPRVSSVTLASPRVEPASESEPARKASRLESERTADPSAPVRKSTRPAPQQKPWDEMTDEEKVRQKILDEIGGAKVMSEMPEFTMLAGMGVKVNKPGQHGKKPKPKPKTGDVVRKIDGTEEQLKKEVTKLNDDGLPLEDSNMNEIEKEIEREAPLTPKQLTEQQKANIATASMIHAVRNQVAWDKQKKGGKTSLTEYLDVYEEYDLGIFPQMTEEEFKKFQAELASSLNSKKPNSKAVPGFVTDPEKKAGVERNVDQMVAAIQGNNFYLGTGGGGARLNMRCIVTEPVLVPAPYGEKWSMDIFALPHNAIKRELVDLYRILMSLQKRMIDLRHSEIDDFYNWWEVFEAFVLDYFEIEERVIFHWIESRIPLGQTRFSKTQRMVFKGRLSRLMHDIDDCEYKFTNLPAGEVLPRLLSCLDRFTPRLLEYFGEQERRLPRAIERKFTAEDKRWADEKMMAFMMDAKYTNELVVLLTRWLNQDQLKDWKRANLKGTARLSYSVWRNQFNKNHIAIVDEMKQREAAFIQPGSDGIGKKAEGFLSEKPDKSLGIPMAKPGVPTFAHIPGKFGDREEDLEEIEAQAAAGRDALSPKGAPPKAMNSLADGPQITEDPVAIDPVIVNPEPAGPVDLSDAVAESAPTPDAEPEAMATVAGASESAPTALTSDGAAISSDSEPAAE